MTTLKTPEGGDGTTVQDALNAKVALETAHTDTEGAYRLSLSDGEQLVDAEQSDVLLEIPEGSSSLDMNPALELSLGSLQDSINAELSEMALSGEAAENYFYI